VKTEKVSVSLPATLLAEARESCGNRGLSRYVAEGLRRQIRAQRQAQFVREWEEEFGALTDEEIEEAREWLRG
jgi:hypothetical protein